MLFANLEEADAEAVGWMPAHCEEKDLQTELAKKSDGSALTCKDIEMNNLADHLAKEGAEQHRVPAGVVKAWKEKEEQIEARARWIGIVTYEANSSKTYPFRDSEAARWKADAAQRRRRDAQLGKDGRRRRAAKRMKREIDPSNGGHKVVKAAAGQGWICEVCKKRSLVKQRLSTKKCGGSKGGVNVQVGREANGERSRGHAIRVSGTIKRCGVCRAFAESRSQRLQGSCKGPPPVSAGGGLRAQLRCLRASIHPVTKERLPQAKWLDGSLVEGAGVYPRLRTEVKVKMPDGFVASKPMDLGTTKPAEPEGGRKATEKRRQLLARIRSKGRLRVRKLREQEAEAEAADLYADFLGQEVDAYDMECRLCGQDGVEAEEFWVNLKPQPSQVDKFANILTGTSRSSLGKGCKPSRTQRLLQ